MLLQLVLYPKARPGPHCQVWTPRASAATLPQLALASCCVCLLALEGELGQLLLSTNETEVMTLNPEAAPLGSNGKTFWSAGCVTPHNVGPKGIWCITIRDSPFSGLCLLGTQLYRDMAQGFM